MSGSNCYFLTCIQISQEAGQVVWYSHLFQNFPQFIVIHTVNRLVPNRKRSTSSLYIVILLIYLICRIHCEKRWAGRNTSWNQDCHEKYQWPQICRWHHPYGRKWRGTKKPLDESERGELKSWLKAQHSENKDHGIWSHDFMEIDGETVSDFILGAPKSLQMVTAAMKLKDAYSWEEKLWPT